jgi:NAD(P)H dehydrogenase (quinone)
MTQHEHVVTAAKEAGVKHVVYTSIPHEEDFSQSPIQFVVASHARTEQLLKNAGYIYTILQHGLYTDMIPVFAGPQLLETKTLYLPAGEGKVSAATRTDMAEAGANVLLEDAGKYDNKILQLTGSEAVSFTDAARYISAATGQDIHYYSPTAEEFSTTLRGAGLPGHVVDLVTAFATSIRIGELALVTSHLEELLGRKPTSAEAFLSAHYHA